MAKEELKLNDDSVDEENEFDDSNIYDEEARSALCEEDEISLNEEAFMKGYENAELNMEEE